MKYIEMRPEDAAAVLPLYIEHYNGYDGSCWTEETAGRRIRQVLTMADAYSPGARSAL